jgi:hypothetical protein
MNSFIEPQEVQRILANLQCSWGVAGGWALDLFLDRITRKHQDIEVAIFRADQLILQDYFASRGWSIEYVDNGQLVSWPIGERLVLPVHEIWCRENKSRIEVLLNECEDDAFVFRRDSRIRAPVERTFIRSNSGIPVLAPEIVLLYKSKRARDPKEQQDFSSVVDTLDVEQRRWLAESIAVIDPDHPWLATLMVQSRQHQC